MVVSWYGIEPVAGVFETEDPIRRMASPITRVGDDIAVRLGSLCTQLYGSQTIGEMVSRSQISLAGANQPNEVLEQYTRALKTNKAS